MPYILDADWIIHALHGRQRANNTLRDLATDRIYVALVTIGEVYEVAFNSPNPEAHLNALREFLLPYRIAQLNEAVVERFAEIRASLRRRGQLISDFDIILAATALQYDLTVLTFNTRHFERIPDLSIYQPG